MTGSPWPSSTDRARTHVRSDVVHTLDWGPEALRGHVLQVTGSSGWYEQNRPVDTDAFKCRARAGWTSPMALRAVPTRMVTAFRARSAGSPVVRALPPSPRAPDS